MKLLVPIVIALIGAVLALNEDELRDKVNYISGRSKRALCGQAARVISRPWSCQFCVCSSASLPGKGCTNYSACCSPPKVSVPSAGKVNVNAMASKMLNLFGKRASADVNFKKPSVDVIFLIDDSGSIQSPQFTVAKEGAAILSRTLCPHTFGSSRAEKQVSVVLFSSTATTVLTYDDSHKGAGYVEDAILNIKQRSGGTSTANALKYVREKVLTQPGNRLNNNDTATVVFVVTDGGCNTGCSQLAAEAKKLREAGPGVQLFAFGIGEANCRELETIRGKDVGAVFGLPDYNFFEKLANAAKQQMAKNADKLCVK